MNYSHFEEESLPSSSSMQFPDATDLTPEVRQFEECNFCDKALNAIDTIQCTKCNIQLHDNCSELDLSTETDLICPLCARGEQLNNVRNDCHKRQKAEADKMISFTVESFPPVKIGECISLSIPKIDRGPLNFNNILGIITDIKNGVFQIGTKNGVINGWFPRTNIRKTETEVMTLENVNKNNYIPLREAASLQSINGGQGFKKCNCKAAANQCKTNRCSCFKLKMLCGSRCHQSGNCCNK